MKDVGPSSWLVTIAVMILLGLVYVEPKGYIQGEPKQRGDD